MESEKIGRERGRRNRGRERERGERDGKSGYRESVWRERKRKRETEQVQYDKKEGLYRFLTYILF